MKNKSYSLLKNSITCFVTIGLLNSILFSTGCVSAQSQSDNLYNPFLLENADYPYKPVGCVVIPSRFDRLRSHEVMDVFQKTFADAGIKLEEKVCLEKDNPGVYLSGYSEEDEIGFVLINRWNMDDSFRESNSVLTHKNQLGEKITLKEQLKRYEEIREGRFQSFLRKNNLSFTFMRTTPANQKSAEIYQKYSDELSKLETIEASRDEFYLAYLKHRISLSTLNIDKNKVLTKNMLMYIDTRFTASPEKLILLQTAHEFRVPRALNVSTEFLTANFEKLKEIKSDKNFITNFLNFKSFIGLNHGITFLRDSKEYQALKAEIIHAFPPNEWFENTQTLDTYYDRRYISLEEAKRIDKRNKNGKQFIAPISLMYDMMRFYPGTSFEYPQEKYDELRGLRTEYREKNALSPEVKAQRKADFEVFAEQYSSEKRKDLSPAEKEIFNKEKKERLDFIQAKYKAKEGLSEEEKAIYQSRIDELMQHLNEWSKNSRAEGRAQAKCKLEEEVKMYIQWVKSQQAK